MAAAPKLKPPDADTVVAVLPNVGAGAGAAVAAVLPTPRAPKEGGGAAAVLLPNVKDEAAEVAAVLDGGFCGAEFPKENPAEVAAVEVIGAALDVGAAEPPN